MKTLISKLTCALAFAALLPLTLSTTSHAQDPRRGYGVGVAGQGTDAWTQAMSGLRLFTPHRDNCNATTEVFIKIYTNSNSIDFGICMDKDEHPAGVLEWDDARKECLDDGKRLPEIGEFKYSCQSVAGLNDMKDDGEWVSNFPVTLRSTVNGIGVPYLGGANCKSGGWAWVGNTSNTSGSAAFRCVR